MRLQVRFLGVIEVILDGQRLVAFNSPRLQRFLALITLRRDPQHRSRLAFELWPDSNESQARTNLRKLLHEFRQSLPGVDEFVEINKETVCWRAAGASSVDVLRFRDAIAAGDLELAARVYSGDLLPGLYDGWVIEARAKTRTEALDVLTQLAEKAAHRDDHKSVTRFAQRIIDLEATDEVAARLQMEAHIALSDKAAALRCYHRYAEALERDLELAPGKAIEALYEQLRTVGTRPGDPETAVLSSVAESPFVGREHEWEQLDQAWKRVQTHGAHLVLVTGEPGIGKSRLAQELGRSLHAVGEMVASARAYEAAGRLPWGPIVELLRSAALRGEISALDAIWKDELARLLPELGDNIQEDGSGRSGDPVQRHRLFDAARRALASGDSPRLLIIDDLQWCDAETIELIGFVISSAQTAPVLIIGTARSGELQEHHALTGLIDSLGRQDLVTTLPLERLDQTTTAALAGGMCPKDELDKELVSRLWAESEGNPLFVIEALRAGITSDTEQVVLTPTIRAVLRARLNQLTAGARQLADVAAVFGRPFTVSLMVSATGADESELIDDLDELWRRRIIRDLGPSYDFSHDKLRAITLESISPVRLRRLHRSVADAIAAESGNDTAAASPQLAAHYHQAGMVTEAIDAYQVAGARAVAVSALEEAVSMFQRALSLLAELPGSSDRDALELDIRIALGSPLVALEGYGSKSSHNLYERARSLCRRLHRKVHPPILRGLGLARLQGCRFDDCDELARSLLDHEGHDPVTMTEGLYLLGVSAFWRGELGTARQHLDGAIDVYDESHSDEHLALYAQDPKAVCLVRLAWTELWAGDADRADRLARSAIGRAIDLDHLMTQAYVVTYAAIVAAESENTDRLAELLEEAGRLWERLSEDYLNVVLEALRGWLDVCGGSAAGIERIVGSVGRSRTEGETLHLTYTLLLLARARGVLGEYHEGRAVTQESLTRTRHYNQRYLEAELLRADGELAFHCGEREAAADSLRSAIEISGAQGAVWPNIRARNSLASRFSG